jgi:hypothetical protein
VYSDKGVWADTENKIDFRHRPVTEMDLKQGVGSQPLMEEFKMREDEDD